MIKEKRLKKDKRGLTLIETVVYLVILIAFFALMVILFYILSGKGSGFIKSILDFFRFGK